MNKSEVETQSSLNRFITLTAIRGSSGNEALVAAEIERQLIEAVQTHLRLLTTERESELVVQVIAVT